MLSTAGFCCCWCKPSIVGFETAVISGGCRAAYGGKASGVVYKGAPRGAERGLKIMTPAERAALATGGEAGAIGGGVPPGETEEGKC